jgi:anti-sigma B factor antagonist
MVVTIALRGELDMATAPILADNLAPFEGNGVSTIVLDLQDLTFIDSSGLLAFLEARRRAMSNGHRLLLSEPSPVARRLIELTGTQSLLDEQESLIAPREIVERDGAGDRTWRRAEPASCEGGAGKGHPRREDETSLLLRLSARDVSRIAYNAIREKPISARALMR